MVTVVQPLFFQAFARGVPEGHAHALVPVLGLDVDSPDFAGGGRGLGVARAVEADEADDFAAQHGHAHLRLAVFDGFAPLGFAGGRGQGAQLFLGKDAFVGGLGGEGMDFGDGLGVAQGGGANFVIGHECGEINGTAYCRRTAKLLAASVVTSGEIDMAKSQQRSTKEAKKPKKDTSPPKPVGTGGIEPVRTITTAVIPARQAQEQVTNDAPAPAPAAPAAAKAQPRNPLHGVTLEASVTALVDYYGWEHLSELVPIRCFTLDPERELEPQVPAQDAVGAREGREPLPLHAARATPRTAATTAKPAAAATKVRTRALAASTSRPTPAPRS